MSSKKDSDSPAAGWIDEIDKGRPMVVESEDKIHVKLVATPKGISIVSQSGDEVHAKAFLKAVGFGDDDLKQIFCG